MGASYLYFQKVPLGWRDAPAVVALAAHIRKRDPRLLLIDLWDWAKCHGTEHPAGADAIERGAGWRGKRGALYAGLLATGWVREQDGWVTILDWEKDGIVRGRPTMANVIPDGVEILDADEKKKVSARLRKQRQRDNEKDVTQQSVTRHTPSVTGRDASVTPTVTDPSNGAESTVYEGIVTPKSKEKEQEKDKEQEKNLVLFAPATSEKALRGRPPKETPEIVVDRERWLAKARALIGLTPEETPLSGAFCVLFAKTRKQRGMEQLMRALEGLEGDQWASKQGLQTLLSSALIEKGLANANRRVISMGVGINDAWKDLI